MMSLIPRLREPLIVVADGVAAAVAVEIGTALELMMVIVRS